MNKRLLKEKRMKNVLKTIIAFLLVVGMFIPINVQAAPTSDMLVTDNTKTLSLDEEKKIESALYQIYEQSGIEYAVTIIDSLKGDSIENAANEQFVARDIKSLFPDKDYHFYNVGAMMSNIDYIPRTLDEIMK